MTKKIKRVLSLDGGGCRGSLPAFILSYIESKYEKPCHELFDMVAGTSIGGIMACLISTGHTAQEIKGFFSDDAPRIFGKVVPFGWGGILRPRYSEEILAGVLKDKLRGPDGQLGSATMEDCKIPIVITAEDVNSSSPPTLFQSGDGYDEIALWKIGRATSAAQTYFKPMQIGSKVLWDGGNVTNNPSLVAYVRACKLWPDCDVHILSLGCGETTWPLDIRSTVGSSYSWGIVKVVATMLGRALDVAPKLVDYELTELMGESESYTRIQSVTPTVTALDDSSPEALHQMRLVSDHLIATNKKVLDDFFAS